MRPVTVPFFISHQGCPHTCVFCDQRTISGKQGALPSGAQILDAIDRWRATAGGRTLEVAFFGGTFTALPSEIQAELLAPLQPLLKDGTLGNVRISTRPDCITDDLTAWLADQGVGTIELGVQSMSDAVLAAAGRGHCAADSLGAIRCIKSHGIAAGVQLMPGLPNDTPETALDSLEQVLLAGADFLRIYPTVVLKDTELARRYEAGVFEPLTLQRGVALCKILLQRAMQAQVPVIRLGLQADHGLSGDSVLAGCWHPALGQMVRSGMYDDLLHDYVPSGEHAVVHCHPGRVSDVIGIRRCNLKRQLARGVRLAVLPDAGLGKEEVKVQTENSDSIYSIVKDINYSIHEV